MSKTSDWLLDPERENDESICYDDDLPIYEAAMGAACEARALEAENAELRCGRLHQCRPPRTLRSAAD